MKKLISFDRAKAIAAGLTVTSVRRPLTPSPGIEYLHLHETVVRIPLTPFMAEDQGTPDKVIIAPSGNISAFFLKTWLRGNLIPYEDLPA